MSEAFAAGVGAYWFVGFVLGVAWTAEVAQYVRDEMTPWELIQGVCIVMVIWPALLWQMFDSENRWKR